MAIMRTSKGFSLIELMIGITLGLLIMTALVSLYLNISNNNQEMAKTNSQIENGRYAIQILESDLEHAGFWGGYLPQFDDLSASTSTAPTDVPDAIPGACDSYSTWPTTDPQYSQYRYNLIGVPVQTYSGVPTGCSTLIANKTTNTDVLLVRHAAMCSPGDTNCEADVSGKLYFQFSRCASDSNKFRLDTSNFTLRKLKCTTTTSSDPNDGYSEKRKFVSNIYYVRNYSVTSSDGIPTLVRSSFDLNSGSLAQQTPEPLISGIEGFRVELGVDSISDDGTDIINNSDTTLLYNAAIKWANANVLTSPRNRGDGMPDAFERPATLTLAKYTNVVVAKIYILARAEKATPSYTDQKTYTLGSTTLGPFNDHYKRHLFSATIRLNNVSGRRETP